MSFGFLIVRIKFFIDHSKDTGIRMYKGCITSPSAARWRQQGEAHAELYLSTDLGCPWIKVLSRLKDQTELCEVLQLCAYSLLMTNARLFDLFYISGKSPGANSRDNA